MKILYCLSDSSNYSNSFIRYLNFKKIFNTKLFIANHNYKSFFFKRYYDRNIYGNVFTKINLEFIETVKNLKPDLIWLDKSLLITRKTLIYIKKKYNPIIINFTNDNPFSNRDSEKNIWKEFIKNIPIVDVNFIAQKNQIDQYLNFGAKKIIRYMHGLDFNFINKINYEYDDKIVFIGSYQKERNDDILFLLKNIKRFQVYGHNWNRNLKNYSFILKKKIKKPIWNKFEYYHKINSSVASLILFSLSNNDNVSHRLFEVPACGGLGIVKLNDEVSKIFSKEEMIFFEDISELKFIDKYLYDKRNKLDFMRSNSLKKIQSLNLNLNLKIPKWINLIKSNKKIIDEYDLI